MTREGTGGLAPTRLSDVLTDGRIVLDAHTLEDAEAHWRAEDEETRRRFEAPRPATLAETRATIERWIYGRTVGGPMFAYAVRTPSGVLMGGCELRRTTSAVANVSYWMFPAYRGQGHAARAVRLLSAAATAIEGLRFLEAHVDADNHASRRTAENAGFAEQGAVEDDMLNGAKVSRILYRRPVAALTRQG